MSAATPHTPLTPKAPPPRPTAAGATAGPSSSTSVAVNPATAKYNPRPSPPPPASLRPTGSGATNAAGSPTAAAAGSNGVVATAASITDSDINNRVSSIEKGINASPLHDVELYQLLVKQLGPNSAVLDSVLFTHRGVLEDSETPQEALSALNSNLEKWKSSQKVALDAQYEAYKREQAFQVQLEYRKEQSEEEKRNAKISDLSMRLEALEAAVKKDVAKVVSKHQKQQQQSNDGNTSGIAGATAPKTSAYVAADGGPPEGSYFRKEWELLQIRKKEREAEAAKDCQAVEEKATSAANNKTMTSSAMVIELAANTAKVGISEQLTRCAVFSEQERERLAIKKELATERERLSALRDAKDYLEAAVIEREGKAWEGLLAAWGKGIAPPTPAVLTA